MKRNILLVEPGFKTKFPPLGLMKISAYHKKIGDKVRFYKGINQSLAYEYWDRIYISTLFTYHWKITIETIRFYKRLARDDSDRIKIGGILSTLMFDEIWKATGLRPIKGILCEPGMLDENEIIVDYMIPDYELFNDIAHQYSLIDDSFFGYSTRGCPNKCKFCGVRMLEGQFQEYVGIKPYVEAIRELYGDRPYLVLFDNNVLASKKLESLIQDIVDLGFGKDEKFSYNSNGRTISKRRRVDFNQGTDLRLMTEKKVKLLSKIALDPLRIAFDHIKDTDDYCKKVRLSAKYGIRKLSNYILYNFNDTPNDLWKRLKINIDLNKELGLQIYSFPMKFIPLNAKDRSFIDEPRWNWLYIRGVQRILNVLKGSVMTSEDFFYRAFGSSIEEFIEILHMPEQILMYRSAEPQAPELEWLKKFRNLTGSEQEELRGILCNSRKKSSLLTSYTKTRNTKIKKIIDYYLPEEKNLQLFPDFQL